jgi:chromosome segregation ATPase
MNQPTREEHEELKRRVAKLERQTEPMRIMRLEIDAGSIYRQLDSIQEDVGVLKMQMEGVRADVSIVKSNQGDLKEYLDEQFKSIAQKQDAHQELIGQMINVGEDHTKRFDRIDASMAELRSAQDEHTKRFDRLEAMMMQILNRLPKAEGA